VSSKAPIDLLTSPARIYAALQELGGGPIDSLGQHFLLDRPLLEAMAGDLGVGYGDRVVEIGPGLGHLTRSLLARGCRVLAVEKDGRLARSLSETLGAPERLEVRHGDALQLSRDELSAWLTGGARRVIAGNLPYYCSSQVLVSLFEEWFPLWTQAGFLLQEEVVDRLVSPPGSRIYGRLSVLVQTFATVRKVRRVPRHLFVPQPEVDSAWCLLAPQPGRSDIAPADLSRMTSWCFAQRRKTIQNNLARKLGKEQAERLLHRAGIDGVRRAETLSVEEFAALVRGHSPSECPVSTSLPTDRG